MKINRLIRLCLPPIVMMGFSNLRQTIRAKTGRQSDAKDLREMVSAGSYTVSFKKQSLNGAVYFVPDFAIHRPAAQAILNGSLYEPQTHAFVCQYLGAYGGNMIHAGTFFGDMLPTFSTACRGTVFAFEPVLEHYILAKLCVEENQLGNVNLMNAGLGPKISMARVDTGDVGLEHQGGQSTIGGRGQLASIVTIDGLDLRDLSIIQLDVEGYELEALSGARETIINLSPLIMIEDSNNNCPGFLRSFGYSLCGEIPGLSIWAPKQKASSARHILDRL